MRAVAVAGVMLVAGTLAAMAEGLSAAQWQFRPLLLFTPSDDDPRLSRQTTMLADEADGMTDRRMGVFIIEGDRVFTTFGGPTVRASARDMRRRYRVPDDAFTVILVGLDGGAKLRVDEPVTPQRLFALIDGMPMRRRELRERGEM